MREIVLDTETTGLDPLSGHRIVEIGCVELINCIPTGNTYHQYLNPERDMPEEAFRVHGLSEEFLAQYPTFREIYKDFLDFVGPDRMVIHNAAFDMKFINAELVRQKQKIYPMSRSLDTVAMARKAFPGSRVNLDALCSRFGIDNSNREKHGALLDAELLAEVYIELCGGKQPGLAISLETEVKAQTKTTALKRTFQEPRSFPLTKEEEDAHAAFLKKLTDPVWSD